jgi:hypothetical protein
VYYLPFAKEGENNQMRGVKENWWEKLLTELYCSRGFSLKSNQFSSSFPVCSIFSLFLGILKKKNNQSVFSCFFGVRFTLGTGGGRSNICFVTAMKFLPSLGW